jgi:cytochrome b6
VLGSETGPPGWTRAARLRAWLDERLGLTGVRQFLAHKTVPVHSGTPWYYFGGITLFLFAIQVLTGILLVLYYRPTAAEAYESVQFIVTRVRFGWLIRSIHSWSANLMIFTAFVHMFSVAWRWPSASAVTCCPGTPSPTSPPRWARTWPPASPG